MLDSAERESRKELCTFVRLLHMYPDDMNIDDLHEHGLEDLQSKFGLQPRDTWMFYMIIQEMTNNQYSLGCLPNSSVHRQILFDVLHEDIPNDWSEEDVVVIRAYLANITKTIHNRINSINTTRRNTE